MESFMKRVSAIQLELKAPKNQRNKFGNYNYRSCEDILEAVKPICNKNSVVLNLSDTVEMVGSRVYVKATAKLIDIDSKEELESTAFAREAETKKGMDDSQITGTASSYARKYALNGLLNIDDTKDADTNEYKNQQREPAKQEFRCAECGREFQPYKDGTGRIWSPEEQFAAAIRRNPDGVPRCGDCRRKHES